MVHKTAVAITNALGRVLRIEGYAPVAVMHLAPEIPSQCRRIIVFNL